MSLRALRLRCAEAAVWTDGFKAYRTEEKWNERTIEECLHSKLGNFIPCTNIIFSSYQFCGVCISDKSAVLAVDAAGLTFFLTVRAEAITSSIKRASSARAVRRLTINACRWLEGLLQRTMWKKNLNRWQKAYWTENMKQLAWKAVEEEI